MTRNKKFARKYGAEASAVKSSIARVARAGRTGGPGRIEQARREHATLMAWVRLRHP